MCATIALTILCPLKIRTLSSTLTLHFPAQGDWASKSSERSSASIPKDEPRRGCRGSAGPWGLARGARLVSAPSSGAARAGAIRARRGRAALPPPGTRPRSAPAAPGCSAFDQLAAGTAPTASGGSPFACQPSSVRSCC